MLLVLILEKKNNYRKGSQHLRLYAESMASLFGYAGF